MNFHTARSLLILRAITGNLHVPGGDVVFERPQGLRVKFPYLDPHFSGFRFMPLQNYQYALDGNHGKQNISSTKRFIQDRTLQFLDFLKYHFYPLLRKFSQGEGQAINLMAELKGARYPLSRLVIRQPSGNLSSTMTHIVSRLYGLWGLIRCSL